MVQGHLVMCGYGEVGSLTTKLLTQTGRASNAITVIERDARKAEQARKRGYRVVEGDATAVHTLRVAQVTSATDLIVCVDDPDALSIVRHLQAAAPETPVKAVLRDRTHSEAVAQAGASEVLILSQVAGTLLADDALKPRGSAPSGKTDS